MTRLDQKKNVTKVARRKCDRAVTQVVLEKPAQSFSITIAKSGTQKDLLLAEDRQHP